MKRCAIGMLALLCLCCPAWADSSDGEAPRVSSFIAVGGGNGSLGSSFSLEVGMAGRNPQTNSFLIALGLSAVPTPGDGEPAGTLPYPVPHSSYRNLGKFYVTNELGIYGRFGIDPFKTSGLYLTGLAGIGMTEEAEIAQSTATGWYYEQSKKSVYNGMYGGGASYFLPNTSFSLHATWDNRRGVSGFLGYSWRTFE